MTEKLQKVLANLGYGSRREIETWISAKRIRINNRLATLGDRVAPSDAIFLDNELITRSAPEEPRVLVYHKPLGVVCSHHDAENRPLVFAQLPKLMEGRWISIGRLDINTSGLLLFTNNGELAHQLMHPSNQVTREYAVRVKGEVDDAMLTRLTRGVMLEDGKARFEDIVVGRGKGSNHWFYVVVVAGRNRLVRRLWQSQGVTVSRLKRVRFGPVVLTANLRQGQYRDATAQELNELRQCI